MSDALHLKWLEWQKKLVAEQEKILAKLEPLKKQIENWENDSKKIKDKLNLLENPDRLEVTLGYFSDATTKINVRVRKKFQQAGKDRHGREILDVIWGLLHDSIYDPIDNFRDELINKFKNDPESKSNNSLLAEIKGQVIQLKNIQDRLDAVTQSVNADNRWNVPLLNILHDSEMKNILKQEVDQLEALQIAIDYAGMDQNELTMAIKGEKVKLETLQKKIERETAKVSKLEEELDPIESELYVTEESFKSQYASGKQILSVPSQSFGKKWCFYPQGAPVYDEPDENEKSKFVIPQGGIVLGKRRRDVENDTSWIMVEYIDQEQVGKQNKWVEKTVTGWVREIYFDDYVEVYTNEEVYIPNKTENPNDAQQYMYLDADFDNKLDADTKFNMCGELCVAYVVKNEIDSKSNIETVIAEWKHKIRSRYSAGTIKHGTSAADLTDMLQSYERYKDPGLIVNFSDGLKDGDLSFEGMKDKLKTHYLLALIMIDHSGALVAYDRGETRHWVVVENFEKNGSRVKIYNPFPNKYEEYSFSEFAASCRRPNPSGLWVKRGKEIAMSRDDSVSVRVNVVLLDEIDTKGRTGERTAGRAEQYIMRESKVMHNLCGEFSSTYIINQSLDNAINHWKTNPPSEIWKIISILKAYGWQRDLGKERKSTDFTVGAVLDLWKQTQPKLYNYHVGDDKGTGTRELRTILRSYGYNSDGDFTDFQSGLAMEENGEKSYQPSPGRIAEKLKTHFLIAGVGIEGSFGRLKARGSIRHWVVLEKLTPTGRHYKTQHWGGNGGWVEIYNPFMNQIEEYSYREFTDAMSETGMWDGLWVKRSVVPVFVKYDSMEALSPQLEEQKTNRRNSNTNQEINRWSDARLLEEIGKRIQNSSDKDIIKKLPQLLFRASGWSKEAIANLLPSTEEEGGQTLNAVLSLARKDLCIKLKTDSITFSPEIEAWISKNADGSPSLAWDLANALYETGILVFEGDKSKKSGKVMDEANSKFKAVPAISEVLSPIFRAKAAEEIRLIREKQLEDEKNGKKSPAVIRHWQDMNTKLYRVRIWGDPQLGFSTTNLNTNAESNFQAVMLFTKTMMEFGAVDKFLLVDREDIDNLKKLQVRKGEKGRLKPKELDKVLSARMNWLCAPRGRIYMYADENKDDWRSSPIIRWGTIALGGNLVRVDEDGYEDMMITMNGNKEKVTMARLVGFRKSDWDRIDWDNLDETRQQLIDEGLIHVCYCANKNNTVAYPRKGIMYSPFFSPLDWDFIGSNKPRPDAFYIPADWLEDAYPGGPVIGGTYSGMPKHYRPVGAVSQTENVTTDDGSTPNIIISSTPSIKTDLFRIRKWEEIKSDAWNKAYLDENVKLNLQAVRLYDESGAAPGSLKIDRLDVENIKKMQDQNGPANPVNRKMNWLFKADGNKSIFTGEDWKNGQNFSWGPIVLGGNFVQVDKDGYIDIEVTKPGGGIETIPMAKLIGFQKKDWIRLDWKNLEKTRGQLVNEGLIHRCYCFSESNNLTDSPMGIVYSPFFSPVDWTLTTSRNAQLDAFYIPVDWLVSPDSEDS